MTLLPNAKRAAGSHPRLALKHQAQRTKGASPLTRQGGEPGLAGLVGWARCFSVGWTWGKDVLQQCHISLGWVLVASPHWRCVPVRPPPGI